MRDGPGRKDLQDIGPQMIAKRAKAPREPFQSSALKETIEAVIA